MSKNIFMKKVLGIVMTAVTMMTAVLSYDSFIGEGTEAIAAGRPVSIDSCTISGGQVVVNTSAASVPGSDDGKFYLFADEVYQDYL